MFDFRSVHIDYAVKQAFRNKPRIKAQAVQSGTENLLVNHESASAVLGSYDV